MVHGIVLAARRIPDGEPLGEVASSVAAGADGVAGKAKLDRLGDGADADRPVGGSDERR